MRIARALVAGCCLLLSLSSAQAQTADDTPLGLWYYRTSFPVGLEGELI